MRMKVAFLQIVPHEQRRRLDVFITEQLARRQASPAARCEQLALVDLAHRMLDAPDDILPNLGELALHFCEAVAGRLSILEPDPSPGVFRWHHLCGTLSRFSGATTPRHFSPSGIVLDEGRPILVQHPERLYDWLAAAGVSLPECLLAPLALGSGDPIGTLWVVSEETGKISAQHARLLQELAAFAGIALSMIGKSRDLGRALERETLLAR